jgi:hypothetical protein
MKCIKSNLDINVDKNKLFRMYIRYLIFKVKHSSVIGYKDKDLFSSSGFFMRFII